jgi:hypothetical protein
VDGLPPTLEGRRVPGQEPEEEPFDDNFEEPVDPRVQIELENLNTLTDLINKLELELDDSRANFRQLLSESSYKINALAKKLGASVEKAKPYYEARIRAKELQDETQRATLKYERASSCNQIAKEMVRLAEDGLEEGGLRREFDPAWQEMLNHATHKVNQAEQERAISEREHLRSWKAYNEASKHVTLLHSQLKRSIVKARPYFEMKAQFNQMLDEQIKSIKKLEGNVSKAKTDYAEALHRLEEISYEIHERRKLRSCLLGTRGVGVGAEACPEESGDSMSDLAMGLDKLGLDQSADSQPMSHDPNLPNPWFIRSSSRAGSEREDCESVMSVRSGDTLDTLDDNAIDHLMLQQELEATLDAEFRDIFVHNK